MSPDDSLFFLPLRDPNNREDEDPLPEDLPVDAVLDLEPQSCSLLLEPALGELGTELWCLVADVVGMSSQGRGPDGSTEEERRGEANGVEEKANGVDVGAGNAEVDADGKAEAEVSMLQ